MQEFLDELDLMLEWYSVNDIKPFKEEFNSLVKKYKHIEGVYDIGAIVAHNYRCYNFNRLDALISNAKEWDIYKK